MMRKFLIALLSTCFTLTLLNCLPAHADTVERYYWNGNEGIIARGGMYNQLREEKSGPEALNSVSLKYRLIRTSLDGAQYQTYGDFGIKGNNYCTATKLSLYLEPRQVPEKIKKVVINDAASHDPGLIGTAVNVIDSAIDACKSSFNNGIISKPATALRHQLGNETINDELNRTVQNFEIIGVRGQNITRFLIENQLATMKDREKARFQHKMCGVIPGGDVTPGQLAGNISRFRDCGAPVREAFDNIWDTCKTRVMAAAPAEVADSTATGANNGRDLADQMKQCIHDYTGVDIDADILNYAGTTEIANVDNPESCSVPYIGWIVCPLSRFLAVLVDNAFEAFQEFFTVTPLDTESDAGKILFASWGVMRNFANVIFAILFLFIILSQVASIGISNYGIKKLLPKLIVTAILVNISYHLCVIAIDISNVLGSSLKSLLELLKPEVATPLKSWSSVTEGVIVYAVGATGIGLVLLTGSLVALFPLLVGAMLSVALAILIILARLAILLALTMIAPLAFVCYLLPNTKQWFDKWLGLFTAMLMVYPVISIVYGLSTVASLVILNSTLANRSGSITLQIFALAIQVIPLAITPLLLKLGGGVLGRIGGIAEGNRLFAKTRERADGFAQRKKNARDVKALQNTGANRRFGLGGLRDYRIQRKYLRKARHTFNKQALDQTNADYISAYTSSQTGSGGDKTSLLERAKGMRKGYEAKTKGEKFAQKLAVGGNTSAVIANAINMQHSLHAKDVEARKLSLRNNKDAMANLKNLATQPSSNEALRQAAIELALESQDPSLINSVVKASHNMTQSQRQVVAGRVSGGSIASGSPYYGGVAVRDNILRGAVTEQNFGSTVVAAGLTREVSGTPHSNFSDSSFGVAGASHIDEVSRAIDDGHITDTQMISDIRTAARNGQSNEVRSSGDTDNMDALRRLAGR